jgi:hypothetical protein
MARFDLVENPSSVIDHAVMAEIIVMRAYVRLPLMRRQADGCWVAPLKRVGDCELRLVEQVGESAGEPVLRVEMMDRRTKLVVDSRECNEVEDAAVTYREMILRANVG